MPSHEMNRRDALRGLTAGIGAASAVWIDQLHALAGSIQCRRCWPNRRKAPRGRLECSRHTSWRRSVRSSSSSSRRRRRLVQKRSRWIATSTACSLLPNLRIANVFLPGLVGSTRVVRRCSGRTSCRRAYESRRTCSPVSRPARPAKVNHPPAWSFSTGSKTLTIAGYYTTEVGLRQELGDDGRMMLPTFEGCTHKEHGA